MTNSLLALGFVAEGHKTYELEGERCDATLWLGEGKWAGEMTIMVRGVTEDDVAKIVRIINGGLPDDADAVGADDARVAAADRRSAVCGQGRDD